MRAQLDGEGLGEAAAAAAADVQYKTTVAVERIAAPRIGAEIGALYIEAGVVEPAVLSVRMQRIHDGFETLDPESEATKRSAQMLAFLGHEPPATKVVSHLDELHAVALVELESHSESETLPLLFAGAWMQAYQLICVAMEDTGNVAHAHTLIYQPQVGAYFLGWIDTMGSSALGEATSAPVHEILTDLRELAMKDPMTVDDVRSTREGLEDILGMM